MSLVGFKARNHPQQKTNPKVDERATAPEFFAPLHDRFRFTIDVAATAENTKLERFYSIEDDGLAQSWAGERAWCARDPHFYGATYCCACSRLRPLDEFVWDGTNEKVGT